MPMNNPWLKPSSSYRTGYAGFTGTILGDFLELNRTVALGNSALSNVGIYMDFPYTLSGGANQWGVLIYSQCSADALTSCTAIEAKVVLAPSAFTTSNAYGVHIQGVLFQAGIPRANTVYGLKIEDQATASANTVFALHTGTGQVRFGDLLRSVATIRSETSSTPTGTAAGTAGDIRWDNGFVYVCTSTNSWKRTALSAF